jgi:hypothetical protein
MPFTISHIAAVLPLRRRCGVDVFAALAIGSMTPDLHYFLPGLREHWPLPSHHPISIPLFCVPAGFLLWWLWRPLWAPMVPGHDTAPPPTAWRIMLALAFGALTHLAWDACTHGNYGLGLVLPELGQPLFLLGSAAISTANLLQYTSSLVGLLLLALAAWPARRRFIDSLRAGVPTSVLVMSLLAASTLTAGVTFAVIWQTGDDASQLRHTLRLTAWNGLSAPMVMLMAYPLVWRWRARA